MCPTLRQAGPGACSCGFQLLRPTGVGSPDAHTPVRSAPTPVDLELVGTEGRRPRAVRNQGSIPTRSASVRSQSGRTAPDILGHAFRGAANRCGAAPSERGRAPPGRPQARRWRRRPQARSERLARARRAPTTIARMRALLGVVLLPPARRPRRRSPAAPPRRPAAAVDGVWPLDARARGGARLRAAPGPLRLGAPRRRPGGRPGPAGARRAARHGRASPDPSAASRW